MSEADKSEAKVEPSKKRVEAARPQQAQAVNWNTSSLHSSYANFCSANSTREEVVLNFGVNKTWDRRGSQVEVELNHRIMLSPFAAKRLAELMSKLVNEYEARYGSLSE
mgnify:CR=1 FL=1